MASALLDRDATVAKLRRELNHACVSVGGIVRVCRVLAVGLISRVPLRRADVALAGTRYARLRKEQDDRITDLSLSVISTGSSPGDLRRSASSEGALHGRDTNAGPDMQALQAKLRHMQNTSTRLVDQLSEQRRAMRQMRLGKDRIIAALQNERLK